MHKVRQSEFQKESRKYLDDYPNKAGSNSYKKIPPEKSKTWGKCDKCSKYDPCLCIKRTKEFLKKYTGSLVKDLIFTPESVNFKLFTEKKTIQNVQITSSGEIFLLTDEDYDSLQNSEGRLYLKRDLRNWTLISTLYIWTQQPNLILFCFKSKPKYRTFRLDLGPDFKLVEISEEDYHSLRIEHEIQSNLS